MALLILISSTGFSMDVHFCQNQVAGISFFGKASCCKKEMNSKSCHSLQAKNQDGIKKDKCCHDETLVIQKTDVDATGPQYITFNDIQLDFVAVPLGVYLNNYIEQLDVESFDQYKPPLPDRDIQVLYQTFLI